MKLNLKIRGKLILYILTVSVVVYAVAFTYIFNIMISDAKKNAENLTNEIAERYASVAGSELNKNVVVARTLKAAFLKYPEATKEERIKYFYPILDNTLMNNPQFMSVWTTWELSALDENYTKPYGRTRTAYFRQAGHKGTKIDTVELDGDKVGSLYYNIKINPEEILINPYYDNYTGKKGDDILMSSVVVPIFVHGNFAGLTGLDVALEQFQYMATKMTHLPGAQAFFISNNGNFVAFSNHEGLIGKPVEDYFGTEVSKHKLIQKIKDGEDYGFYMKSGKTKYYVKLTPFSIGQSKTPWSVGIMIPNNAVMKKVRTSSISFIIGSILGLLLMLYAIFAFSGIITRPLNDTISVINRMAVGDIGTTIQVDEQAKDEISEMRRALNALIIHLNKTSAFALEIGKGNLEFEYEKQSDKDTLGNALLEMRKSLKDAEDMRVSREEHDRQIAWATSGTAKFADILRKHSDNLEELAYQIISELVKYLDANQGGLFILVKDKDNKNSHIELIGSYAYDRRKMLKKRIPYGVGLIGRCIIEAESIYMTKVPDEYINITSGLGATNPHELLIVPLIFNEEVFGVVEIASFTRLEDYKREFVERIGESIASTISMVNINARTAKLLEETKTKTEQMASQEEEIRQNMEEMKSSQEEMTAKANELASTIKALKSVAYITEYDVNGRIIDINSRFLNLLDMKREDIIGKYQGSLSASPQNLEEFNELWDKLRAGQVKRYEQDIFVKGKAVKLSTVYAPVKNADGKVFKVISVSEVIA